MACSTYEELEALLESVTEEEFDMLSEEQLEKINARVEELEPAPLPAEGNASTLS